MTNVQTQDTSSERVYEPAVTERYYVTTAIDYPNAPPHIGHALEKVLTDAIARYHRLRGDDTFFSMGVDENSLHVLRAARAANVEPQVWVKELEAAFRLAWSKLDISYDRWIRTTEVHHRKVSQEIFRRAQAKGDIYRSVYSGWYCPNCNTFYKSEDLIDGRCPNHPTLTPEWLDEENYFFSLSRYGERLLAHIEEHPEFIIPAARRAEVISVIKEGLKDFSISRQVRPGLENWGIPVPGDPQQVIYVWFDALTNYLTNVGFLEDEERFARYWPADAHVIGKDITRFHCLYWPAMLLSADLPLPRQIPVHGFMTLEGQRISKTRGNVIDPVQLADKIGSDAIRYYLLRNLSLAVDGNFTREGLLRAYNDELGNDLGNLLQRFVAMSKRYRGGAIPQPDPATALDNELQRLAEECGLRVAQSLEAWEIGRALEEAWSYVRRVNQYIEQCEPWKLARQEGQEARLDSVLYTVAESLRLLSIWLTPFIPSACQRLRAQLGLETLQNGAWREDGSWGACPLSHVVPGPVLFPRLDESVEV
ncbi:methionine--tRNA ligase [Ktedonospora formicarum]|uniref:Methionine--tRNA ligase n=1 Tax=Ktedonospora formicarum TaxID=2778364 RepID=A0A8J3MPT0_9CHLR|nr:methionine--tRNA ligase [Ktedonospora formicarum]GHO43225.1 methionine--tRNA ligase [Ktedonospora formicarum]